METMNDNWKRITVEHPPEGIRVIISDGETITIARYVTSENHLTWLFDCEAFKDMNIDYWQELPTNPPKIEVISAEK